jgi:D-3-phosphoglycerate dehydrogenase
MKILIADEMHPSINEMIEMEGWEYNYVPDASREDILAIIHEYDGLIIRSKTFVDKALLACAGNLKFIARAGAGLDLIDLKEVGKRNIRLFHAGEANRDAVAEHVLGMILALFNNLVRADSEVRKSIWLREENRGVELMSQTVGLIGYGNNGGATAKRLKSFGCKVLAYDKYRSDYGDEFAQEATLEQIMKEATLVSMHVPLTDETRGMINDEFVSKMVHPFYLVNASRGEVARLKSVVNGLESGKILGACLDVLENEKLKTLTEEQQKNFNYLIKSDKVILSPHVAGWSKESYIRINEVLKRQIKDAFQP